MKNLIQIYKQYENDPKLSWDYCLWYGDCLTEIVNHFTAINIANESENKEPKTFKSTDLEDMFRNLLK